MVSKYVIDISIVWLNDNIYSRNTWFPTTDVQTQNIGKLWYANRRAPTECGHTVATQATEYQRWRDVGCRSRRCRPMPTFGRRRNASWVQFHCFPKSNWRISYQIIEVGECQQIWERYVTLNESIRRWKTSGYYMPSNGLSDLWSMWWVVLSFCECLVKFVGVYQLSTDFLK